MDFFTRQAEARVASARAAVMLAPVVLALFAAVDLILYACAFLTGVLHPGDTAWSHLWTFQALLGTLLLVGGGALLEWLRLRDGGRAVAEMLGARAIDFGTREPLERRFRHVVEEMSIASGTPAPLLYVLDRDPGVNAFVAGYTPAQSVLVVTRGALDHLDRDELQGLVAHEFSHILHGDMRLNMRLLTGLAGILSLGQLGGFLMRSLTRAGPDGAPLRNPVYPVWLLGAMVWLAGATGLVLGRLIKALVSREREFLADAAAVQFTRNPAGLAGALYQVMEQGSLLNTLHAESLSHLCFGQSVPLARWFATHPPVAERIERIYPGYLARRRHRPAEAPVPSPVTEASPAPGFNPEDTFGFGLPVVAWQPVGSPEESVPLSLPEQPPAQAEGISGHVGVVRPDDLASARALRRSLPPEVSRALRTVTGASAVLYAVIDRRHPVGTAEMTRFFAGQAPLLAWVEQLRPVMAALDIRYTLPLVELCLSRLAALDRAHLQSLREQLDRFVRLDRTVSFFDFALLTLVSQQLTPRPAVNRAIALPQAAAEVSRIIAALLSRSTVPPAEQPATHARLLASDFAAPPAYPDAPQDLAALSRALRRCRRLEANAKRTLLELCARTVACDGRLHLREYELVRVIALTLGCPLPLLQGVILS